MRRGGELRRIGAGFAARYGVAATACAVGILCFSLLCAAEGMKAPGNLTFGARPDVAPLSNLRNGEWAGYSIDLCQRIYRQYQFEYQRTMGDSTGAEDADSETSPRFIPVSAADRIDALVHGRIDMLCGATTVTIERMRRVDFSLLTFVSGASVMKQADTDAGLLKQKQEEPKNIKVAFVGSTTTQRRIVERFGSSVQTFPKADHTLAFQALREGAVDFYFGDRVILAQKLASAGNPKGIQLASGFLSFEPYALAVAKTNQQLLQISNSVLARLYRSGEINQIYGNHFRARMSDMLQAMYRLQSFPED